MKDKPKEKYTKMQSSWADKIKDKYKILKSTRENDNTQQVNSHQAVSSFLNRNFTSKKGMAQYI